MQSTDVELFGDKTMRWFQVAARNGVRQALEEGHRRICVVQPTGTGKTISSGVILIDSEIRKLLGVPEDRPINVLFACHRHRLLTQAENTYAADERINVITQMISSPIPNDIDFDIVINDECHHEATMTFQSQLESLTKAPIIGLTADINRNDKHLCKFSKIIEPITRQQSVEQGYLAQTYLRTFVDSPARDRVDICRDIIELYHHEMKQTMVFVRTKAEARKLESLIKKMGLTAESLIDISEQQLDVQLDNFEKGVYQFAISCMKLGEGIDVRGCESVLIGRVLQSRNLLNQIIGRGSRPDCDCRVYEIINPLSDNNIDVTTIVGTPVEHHFSYKIRGEWRVDQLV